MSKFTDYLGNKLLSIDWIRDDYLITKYQGRIHDLNIGETIDEHLVGKLMKARDLGVDYCVTYDGLAMPRYPKPVNPYFITTNDIKITYGRSEDDETKTIERANIYWFLEGKQPVKTKEEYYKRKKKEEDEKLAAIQAEQNSKDELTAMIEKAVQPKEDNQQKNR